MNGPVSLGARLKESRQRVRYSVDDLSVTCGLTRVEIEAIEEDRDACSRRIGRIAVALGISPEVLSSAAPMQSPGTEKPSE